MTQTLPQMTGADPALTGLRFDASWNVDTKKSITAIQVDAELSLGVLFLAAATT